MTCTVVSMHQRALRTGQLVLAGLVFATAISRFAALLDMLVRLDALDREVLPIVAEAVRSGTFRGGREVFINAYSHLPSELVRDVDAEGFNDVEVFSTEGPGFLVQNFEERWADPARRETLLAAARDRSGPT